ncbi:hypothetical protein [Lamprocystis purpurea]|uniref:hypothetical protein n=1 Tax=Lamprocystis purpurea TaxID=61598 RepID=UPI00039C2BE9|nr:hypothetical protein [Lamprocystis purpurea]
MDALLLSPWAAGVAVADDSEMQRLAAGDYHSLASVHRKKTEVPVCASFRLVSNIPLIRVN